jgi:hypothetical protein
MNRLDIGRGKIQRTSYLSDTRRPTAVREGRMGRSVFTAETLHPAGQFARPLVRPPHHQQVLLPEFNRLVSEYTRMTPAY